jgi:hypothetical protein
MDGLACFPGNLSFMDETKIIFFHVSDDNSGINLAFRFIAPTSISLPRSNAADNQILLASLDKDLHLCHST